MTFDFQSSRQYLQGFEFQTLFLEKLNWSNPTSKRVEPIVVEDVTYRRRMIAQVAGVAVYEVVAGQVPGERVRQEIYRQTVEISAEHLLIFVDDDRSQSYWYWVKRDGKKEVARHLTYYRGQSGDLILGKLGALVFELEDFEQGAPRVVEAARKLQEALDVEKVTKKFYAEFKEHLEWFVLQIEGIGDENDRRWYASVILNRLMFVYFLQKKGFVDENPKYLGNKFELFEERNFYADFLKVLFFEGFAKAAPNRSAQTNQTLGEIKYLNGGLFARHWIEKKYEISIANEAFGKTLTLFERYSWNLDDSPGGKDEEIRPEVLGYIFEKYINQKEFGAYYTRPEITEYLCDRTINKLILDKVNAEKRWQFGSIEELLFNLDGDLCLFLLEEILPKLSLLDPACGSGAFLVAAMKTLINVYAAVIGRIEFVKSPAITKWLQTIRGRGEKLSVQYYIKKRIITDNLYGVDIMEEATEITKLRLFLALVASATTLEELEPLPNVDFNIMAGNSLIGLIRVDEDGFNGIGSDDMPLSKMMAANDYRRILERKNASIKLYKEHAFLSGKLLGTDQGDRLQSIKTNIEHEDKDALPKLNALLFDEFGRLKIKYEQAQATGKATKRLLNQADIDRLKPFHWGYHFDQVMERGGFDAIIANPPWEVFKPNAKEFFAEYSDLVTKKKMDIKAFEKHQKELLQDPEIASAWATYQSQFPYVSSYFKSADQYKNQISVVNGKKAGTDTNLYKLFLELCFNLLKPSGECGIVIPSGIYTDLGCKQLREMLFSQTQITGLFCFENRKEIFEGVHRSFKFVVLSFEKGSSTKSFPAAFMRHDVQDLTSFPSSDDVVIDVELVRKLSPDSISVMEFKGDRDIEIANKLFQFPKLGEQLPDTWNLKLCNEFHMTNDSHLFKQEPGIDRLPLYEGKMIHQFNHKWGEAKYWISENEGRSTLLGKQNEESQNLNYQKYRLAFREIARNTDTRSLITSLLPINVFANHKLMLSDLRNSTIDNSETLYLCAVLNSFVVDSIIRQRIAATISMFIFYQTPVPRLTKADRTFQPIVDRAAKLICTTPEFDDLATEVGLGNHTNGVTDEIARANLRAELDGIIAHLYNLTKVEFAHILSTFPIVPEATKDAALQAYRDFTPPQTEPEILHLLQQGESNTVEFKSTARWNLRENKKDRTMEEVILKTIAAFLNTQGGTLLIGVADDSSIVGLELDYQTFKKRDRDGFELWLMGDLLLKEMGKAIAPYLTVTFHSVDHKDICRIAIVPAPEPIYVDIRDKSGQLCETFFIRTGNSTNKLEKPSEITKYIKQR